MSLPFSGVFREPLAHFVLLASLLFIVEHIASRSQKEQIVITGATAEYLVKQREDLELRKLSAAEREDTISSYVEDEILYSEAYKRGLDRGDSRMRRNMILKMRGLLVGDIKEPDEDTLRAYFAANQDQFTNPETISLDHVYFSDIERVPTDLLEQLKSGVDHRELGDRSLMLGASMQRVSKRSLAGGFGSDTALDILAIKDDQWHGPFESLHGAHFVRITEWAPATSPRFEDVASYIGGHWMMTESRRVIEQEITRLQNDYEILIETEAIISE